MAEARPETVTVVFTDVVGSTMWRARVGDDVADVRTAELERASRVVVASLGGTVVKSLGDGVMATFSSAVDGLDAAVALQAVARRLAVGGTNACLRVGVSSGDMVREGADWLGVAAIEASRLCAEAAGGSVLVADVTLRLCRGRSRHELRHLGDRVLRGFDIPVEVYELVSDDGSDASLPSALGQSVGGPMVGRNAEQVRAGSLLEAAATGAATTLFIVGEPGVGKSRLAAAVAADALARGFSVVYGRCEEGLSAPYQPVVEAFGPWLAGCPDAALKRIVGDGGAQLAQLWPELAPRMALRPGASGADPDNQRWRLFEAVVELVRSIAAERPLLLVVDDLQWAEPSTLLLLAHIARRAVAGTVVVATTRPGEAAEDAGALLGNLIGGRSIEVVELDGLDHGAVAEFVALHAGSRPPDELCEQLRRQTDGNPFFLEAVLAHLEDVAFVRSGAGVWLTAAELAGIGVPKGVRGVVARRLSLLDVGTRRALDVAAVCGVAFDERIVRGVLGPGFNIAVDPLEEAMTAGLVREDGVGRFVFVHALVRHAVLDSLSRTRAAHLHWSIAEELERAVPDDPSRLGEIAYHYASGGDIGDAATLARSALAAGDDAFERQAFEEAGNHFRTALGAMDRMAPDETRRCDVLVALGEAQACAGQLAAAKATFLDAAAVAGRADLPVHLARSALGYGGRYVWGRAGDDCHLIPLLDDALAALPRGDSPERVRLLGRLACARRSEPDREVGARMSAEALAMAERLGDPATLAYALEAHHGATFWYDNPEQRLQLAAQQMDIAQRSGDKERIAHVHLCRTSALFELGQIDDAEATLGAMTRLAEEIRQPAYQVMATSIRAMLALFRGEFELANELMLEERRVGEPALTAEAEAWIRSHDAWLRRVQGRYEGLETMMRDAAERIFWYPMFRCFLVELYSDLERESDARRMFDELAADNFAALLPRDNEWLLGATVLADVCGYLNDTERARVLYEMLLPVGHLNVVGLSELARGSASRSLGVLATTMGRFNEAEEHFKQALDDNTRFRARPWVARTQFELARMLLARDRRGDRTHAIELLASALETARSLEMTPLAARILAAGGAPA